MEKEVIDGSTVAIYFGLAFIFYMMLMFYMSLKHRLMGLDREIRYLKEEVREINQKN
jgi:uncharacterized membrane protein YciS (DUF1049 family)